MPGSGSLAVMRLPAVALVVLAFLAGGCAPGISQKDLLAQMQGSSPPLILDVRTAREFRDGHLAGAVNISIVDDFRNRFERLNPPKDKSIVVICEHGPRASFAGFVLKASGYTSVYNLDGAMKAWKANKLPMEK